MVLDLTLSIGDNELTNICLLAMLFIDGILTLKS